MSLIGLQDRALTLLKKNQHSLIQRGLPHASSTPIHCKKYVNDLPVPMQAGCHLPNNLIIPRQGLVCDIPARDGKMAYLFFTV